MLTVITKFKAKVEKYEEAKRVLYSLVVPTLLREGCLQYDLHESQDEPGIFFLYENWADDESLAKHLKNDYNEDFRKKANALLQSPMEIFRLSRV